MNKIVIITPYVRLDIATTLERIFEDLNSNNDVEQIIINDYMTFVSGVSSAGKVVSSNQLVVIRESDGTISDYAKILVDLASETDTRIYYLD